jgi:glycosyltransferase involved in cell wall biosynthesis
MILHVMTAPTGGGAEVLVRELNQRYRARGVGSEVVFFSGDQSQLKPGEVSLGAGPRSVSNIWKLRSEIVRRREQHPDLVVHAHLTWPFIYVVLATLFMTVRRFYTEHNTHNRRRNLPGFRLVDRLLYARYEKVICISDGVYQSLFRWLGAGLSEQRLVTIPNGARLHDARVRGGVDGRKVSLVSVGSLTGKKNFAVAIEAVSQLRDRVKEYVIVGEGPERARLEELIVTLGLSDLVTMPGWSDDVEGHLGHADLQLIPSQWEGFGLVAAEGMSTGLPVVVSQVSGLKEVVGPESDAVTLVAEHQSASAWASAVSAAISKIEQSGPEEISIIASTQAGRFSLDKMVSGYIDAYETRRFGPNLLLFVVNCPAFFVSHRLPIALAARDEGYDVHIATGPGEQVKTITGYGFEHHLLPLNRSGQKLWAEIRSFLEMKRLFRNLKPEIVHLVTIKPVIYGSFAARLEVVPAVVAAVSGLGTVFLAGSMLGRIRRGLVLAMYRLGFGHKNLKVILQNADDRRILESVGAVKHDQSRLIRGAGVDLDECRYKDEPEGRPLVVMAARLLKDKGIYEFVEASQILACRGVEVGFRVLGDVDIHNRSSVSAGDLEGWKRSTTVEFLGYREDIAQQYERANIVCLPSYREGLSKSLLEGAACGRAIVTTDAPGCRDAVEPGETGILVPVKDAVALAEAIQKLAENPVLRMSMGKAGRALAEKEFSSGKIIGQHLAIYRELLQ